MPHRPPVHRPVVWRPHASPDGRRQPSYYGSAAWKALRLACLKRDRFLCQLHLSGCQVRASIADHIVERKAGGADTLHNLRGVCVSCHAKRHPEKGGFDA